MASHLGPNLSGDGLIFLIDPVSTNCSTTATRRVHDLSPRVNDMTASSGLTWSADQITSPGFNFGLTWSNILTDGNMDLPSSITVNTWLLFTTQAMQRAVTLGLYQTLLSDDNQSAAGHIWIYRGQGNSNVLSMSYSNGTTFQTISSNGFFTGTTDKWVNTCVTINYLNGDVVFYRNGTQFSTATMTTPVLPVAGRKKSIGHYRLIGSFGNEYTAGTISHFAIYSRLLSAAEVSANFEALRKRHNV